MCQEKISGVVWHLAKPPYLRKTVYECSIRLHVHISSFDVHYLYIYFLAASKIATSRISLN